MSKKRDYYIPINSGFIEKKHLDILGTCPAILFELLVDWITEDDENDWGICKGGRPITYCDVEKRMSISRSTYTRYMKVLMSNKYIKTTKTLNGIIIAVRKSKKWGRRSKNIHKSNESNLMHSNPNESELSHSIEPKMKHDCFKNDANDASKMTQTYIKDKHTVKHTDNNKYTPNSEKTLSEKINDYRSIKELVNGFYEFQYQQYPKQLHAWKKKPAVLESEGIVEIDRIIKLDGYILEDIKNTLQFAVKDCDFWSDKIQSLKGLRKKKPNGNTKFTNVFNNMNRGKKDLLDPLREWQKSENEENYAPG